MLSHCHILKNPKVLKPYPKTDSCVSLCQAAKDAKQSLIVFVSVSN